MMPKKKITTLAVAGLLLVSAAAGLVYTLNGKSPEKSSSAGSTVDSIAATDERPDGTASDLYIPVEGDAAIRDTLVLTVTAAGQVAPWRQSIITAQVAGAARAVNVLENAAVGTGSPLVTIDPAEYELALAEAQASLRTAEAQYRETTLFDERRTDAAVRGERQKAARAKS